MKTKRNWSNSEMRSLTRGEAMHYFSTGQHYSTKDDWYIWFLGNGTRYAIFHTFLWKYGNGEMVSYTDLTRTAKVGSQRLKIDSIKATIREGLSIRDFKNISGRKGNFQKNLKVYERDKFNCKRLKCRGIIQKKTISNRSTFFCNTCQK